MKNFFIILLLLINYINHFSQTELKINEKEYFETPGLNVIVFQDYYPDGHQTGVTIIQHDERTAANGDVRLEASPGQWSPVPKLEKRIVGREKNEISVNLSYPDPSKNRKGFNPILYPDLKLNYKVRVKGTGKSFKIFIDLEKPLPDSWVGKVGFNLELFPGLYFGKSYILDNDAGIFPEQANGPVFRNKDDETEIKAMAIGKKLTIASEDEKLRMTIQSEEQNLILLDGRGNHYNGWFIIRSLLPANKTIKALEWTITPNVISDWKYKPVIQVSQVGYHTKQSKIAVIEQDKKYDLKDDIILLRLNENGSEEIIKEKPDEWGEFLRYKYLRFDFSKISQPGMYQLKYGDYITNPFKISDDAYSRNVWQPALEYFLPIQMCHMRVNDGYRVWHGLCHEDDALMAEVDTNHFDGYLQGPSTLTKYKPLEHVPGLNAGGWHDAGDDDLRVESQAGEIHILSTIYEEFNIQTDETTIDQVNKIVEIHQPDGKPDILQQIEHGAVSIVNGYNSLGRLYRGIITPTLRQYVLLGDPANVTDNRKYNPTLKENSNNGIESGNKDDRWVFTEKNPYRELQVADRLAASYRVLKNYNPKLAADCLRIAEVLWNTNKEVNNNNKIVAAVELFISTGKDEYRNLLLQNLSTITEHIDRYGWNIVKCLSLLNDNSIKENVLNALQKYKIRINELQKETPYGVPYKPDIWGAGWSIQDFGVKQYFLHKYFPEMFPVDNMLNAVNFILGCHPGKNTSSFVSGVGANSLTVAYGFNRADWSYIPGGVGSGTALIRPDLPELKIWPYFWQQTEYVMGGGATNFMFLVLAADKLLNTKEASK